MNIFQILSNLYTNPKADWIIELNSEDIKPYLIQRWLVMNDKVRGYARWLDKYVFPLQNHPKMYLSLAWSIIADVDGKKFKKTPFIKYIKKAEEETEFDFILMKVRKHFKMSDNDYRHNRNRILVAIRNDMSSWFSFYGIEKRYWKKYCINFDKIKQFGNRSIGSQEGLTNFS